MVLAPVLPGALVLAPVMGALAGLYPAVRAARLAPAEALRIIAVTELCGKLGLIEALDEAMGPVKQRRRGFTGGQVLTGMAAAQLAGEDFLVGLDRVAPIRPASRSPRFRAWRPRPRPG